MILAIDTATRSISLALHDGEQIIAETTWLTDFHHTVELAPALDAMFKQMGITPNDLRAVAVVLGPGSFTGLRIGMSVAKGLSLATDPHLPLIGIPTLDVVAAAQPHLVDRLCAVARAGRGRVSAGFYRWEKGEWQSTDPPFIATWEELVARLEEPTQVGGEVDPAGQALLTSSGKRVTLSGAAHALRRAGFLAELAYRRFAAGDVDDPATLAPIYLR